MTTAISDQPLTSDQINTYLRGGILVVDNLLSSQELHDAQCGLVSTLKEMYGVDVNDLENTGHRLVDASSTNGAGMYILMFFSYLLSFASLIMYIIIYDVIKYERRSTGYLLSRMENENSYQ